MRAGVAGGLGLGGVGREGGGGGADQQTTIREGGAVYPEAPLLAWTISTLIALLIDNNM